MTSPTPIAAAAGTTRGSRSPRRDLGRPERDPWDVEYGRDVWRLRLVGVQDVNRARIRFEAISQEWLKELAKRWARWRLVTGSGAGSVASGTQAVTRFALFLSTVAIEHADQLDRAVLERHLAHLHAQLAGRTVHWIARQSSASTWMVEFSGRCQPFVQPVQAAFDHLAVAVVAQCANSSLTTLELLAGSV